MIDEKELEFLQEYPWGIPQAPIETLIEIVNLALWAKKNAIPAMEESIKDTGKLCSENPLLVALAVLPEDKDTKRINE